MNSLKLFSLCISLVFYQELAHAQNMFSKQDEKSGLYGFANTDDNYIVKPKYKEVDFNFGNTTGLSKVINKNNKAGFVNQEGKEVVPCKYDDVTSFENGYCVVEIKIDQFNSKYGLLDSTGKEVIPMKYGKMEYYPKDKVLVVGEDNTSSVGLADLAGKIIISAQYEFWSKTVSKGLWPVGKNNICGVVNLKNEVVVPFTYEMIESYSDEIDLAAAKKDGKYGFIDRTGKVVIPFIYTDGWPSGPYISVKKEKKWGLISVDNKILLPFDYTSVSAASNKTAWVTTNENESAYQIDIITKQKVK